MKIKKTLLILGCILFLGILFYFYEPLFIKNIILNLKKSYKKIETVSLKNVIKNSNNKLFEAPVINVKVKKLLLTNLEERLAIVGSFNSKKEVNIYPEITGKIIKLYVDSVGKKIKKGEKLLKIKDSKFLLEKRTKFKEYESNLIEKEKLEFQKKKLTSDILSSEENTNQKKEILRNEIKKYNNKYELYKLGECSLQDLNEAALSRYNALFDLYQTQIILLNDKNSLTELKLKEKNNSVERNILKLKLDEIDLDIQKTLITSPISGILISKKIEEGEMIESNDKILFTIMQNDESYFEAEISENDLSKIKLSQNAYVIADAYPEKNHCGKIIKINPIINPESRTCSIVININNEKNLLKPGLFGRGYIITNRKENVFAVPKSCLIPDELSLDENAFKIFTIQNNFAISKSVKTGTEMENLIEIVGDIKTGNLIVTENQNKLKDFAKVKYTIQESKND